jgi:K+ transporter
MHGKLNSTSTELKKVERRIDTLKEHLRQSGYFKEHRQLKRQYDKLCAEYTAVKSEAGFFAERKVKKALEALNDFKEANHTGWTLYIAAEKYLREHSQKHFDPKKLPPIAAWEKELAEKLKERDSLYREYYALKDETEKVEKIRRSIREIQKSESPEQATPTRTKVHDVSL